MDEHVHSVQIDPLPTAACECTSTRCGRRRTVRDGCVNGIATCWSADARRRAARDRRCTIRRLAAASSRHRQVRGLAVDPADTPVSAADPHWQHTSDAPLCAVAGAMPRAAAAAHRRAGLHQPERRAGPQVPAYGYSPPCQSPPEAAVGRPQPQAGLGRPLSRSPSTWAAQLAERSASSR